MDDAAGAPLAGVWVALSPGAREAQTEADGVARFDALGAGTWEVLASGAGYEPAAGSVDLVDTDTQIALTLSATPPVNTTLSGRVDDLNGDPVADATVWLDDVAVATTDADGAFRATGLTGGTWAARVEGPEGGGWSAWDTPELTLTEGAAAEIAVTLGGDTPPGARYSGSEPCLICHADLAEAWRASPHAQASRSPDEVAADADLADLTAAFVGGDSVTLDDLGATVALSTASDGAWQATLTDAWGDSTGAMPVAQVYGGHRAGAALAVQAGDTLALLPLAWARAGLGAGSAQAEAGWVEAWTAGWFDAEGRLSLDAAGQPGPDASFALQCAGCHSTGAVLTDADGAYRLDPDPLALDVEPRVGCEACHGAGSGHSSTGKISQIINPGRMPPHRRVEVCARCHERTTATEHPFADAPGYPVDAGGGLLGPADLVSEFATAAPERWLDATASRVGWDQVGELRGSPHLAGPEGYQGACEDCHLPHGGDATASLRAAPTDNTLCTTCHAAAFPDEAAQASHSHHSAFHPGAWTPGSCTGCHLPRMALTLRPDAVSGAGEGHTHGLDFIEPQASLAEFDAAGASVLPLGAAPVPACLDCHLQADALAEDADSNCPCPVGSPQKRVTYEDFQTVLDLVWGAR